TTTATSLDTEQDKGNIIKTQSKATPNEPSSLGTSLVGGPRRQDTKGDTIAQTGSENVSKFSNDPLLAGVNTPQSREDSLKLTELMEICEEVVVEKEVAGKDVSAVEEVNAASIATSVTTTTPTISMDEITLAKALIKIKTSIPKAKVIVMQKPSETPTPTPIVSSKQPSKVQDKGKGIMVEPEMPLKKKAHISLNEEFAFKLQADEDEQERIVREKTQQIEEVNLDWDDIQAKVDADYELAQRLHAEEQEQLTDAEKAKLFMEFMKKRIKSFASKRAEEREINHLSNLNKGVL
nr:hypothetical protein [Tanacetum cinerariifolium]